MKKIAATLTALAAMAVPNVSHAQTATPPQSSSPSEEWKKLVFPQAMQSVAGKKVLNFTVPYVPVIDRYNFQSLNSQTQEEHIADVLAQLTKNYPEDMARIETRLNDFGTTPYVWVVNMLSTMPRDAGSSMRGANTTGGFAALDVCVLDHKTNDLNALTFDAANDIAKANFTTRIVLRLLDCRNSFPLVDIAPNITIRPDASFFAIRLLQQIKVPETEIAYHIMNGNQLHSAAKGFELFTSLIRSAPAMENFAPNDYLYKHLANEYFTVRDEYHRIRINQMDVSGSIEYLSGLEREKSIRGAAALFINWLNMTATSGATTRPSANLAVLNDYINKEEVMCAYTNGETTGNRATTCTPLAPRP